MKNFKPKLIIALSFYLSIFLCQAFGQVTGPVSVPHDPEDAFAVDVPVLLDPDGIQQEPVAVVDRQGNLMVVWRDFQDNEQSIKAQGFDRFGDRLGSVATVSDLAASYRGNPDVAVDFDGTFVITWEDSIENTADIYYRSYDRYGVPWDVEPQLAVRHGSNPSVAVDSAGNVLLVWQEETDQGTDILGARYALAIESDNDDQETTGVAWTGPDTLNYTREGFQEYPEIAADMSGNFAVAWMDDSIGVQVRFFQQNGEYISSWAVGDTVVQLEEYTVSDSEAMAVSAPSVALVRSSPNSSFFLICWIDSLAGGNVVRLRQFNLYLGSDQVTVTPETLVDISSDSLIRLHRPEISANKNGTVVVTWHQMTGDRLAVIAKIFSAYNQPYVRIDTLAWKQTDQPGDIINLDVALRAEGGYVVVREDTDTDLKMQNITTGGKGNEQPFQLSVRERADESDWSAALVAHDEESFTLFWERLTSDTLDVDTLFYKIDTLEVKADTVVKADTIRLPVAEISDTVQVRWARFDFAGKFIVSPQDLAPEGEYKQRQPVAAKGPGGSYVVLWHEQKGSQYRIRAKLFDKQHNLRFDDPLIEWQSEYFSNIAVCLDSLNQIYMAWEQWEKEASAPLLKRARFCCIGDGAGSSSMTAAIRTVSDGGRMAGINLSDKGTYMIVWRQSASLGQNASIRGIILDDQDYIIKDELQISTDEIDYLGGVGSPVVVSSPVDGNYLVVWQEFFAQQRDFRRNRLYCSLFHWQGDTEVVKPYQRYFDFGENSRISPASPAVSVDASGNYLILWVEMNTDGAGNLAGMRLDPSGNTLGGKFRVPNATLGALPVIDITASNLVVVAWQDTVGDRVRVLSQVLKLEFYKAGGMVNLAGFENSTKPVFVHISGNVNDSSLVDRNGRFYFQSLVPGEYRMWLSVGGERLSTQLSGFTLSYGDSPSLDLGTIADLSGVQERVALPRVFALHPNAPNPFNPSTTISFEIPDGVEPVRVLLAVYDLRGRLVNTLMDEDLVGGAYSLVWDGRDSAGRKMASGVYFLRLRAGAESMVRKMILLK